MHHSTNMLLAKGLDGADNYFLKEKLSPIEFSTLLKMLLGALQVCIVQFMIIVILQY